jgi:hypothetical protein
MKQQVIETLTAAGYRVDRGTLRQMSDTSQQYRWDHKDGAFYHITENLNAKGEITTIRSWFYRGLGGNAKSAKWDDQEATLVAHLRGNKKRTPKTKIERRTSDEVRRANFVLYD